LNLISLLGVEDGGFIPFQQKQKTILCATNMIGNRIEEVRLGSIIVDGFEVTEVLLKIVVNVKFDVVILGGASFAGFNVIDAKRLNQELDVPIIVYSGTLPNSNSVLSALKKNFVDWDERWALIERLGKIHSIVTKVGCPPIYYELIGQSTSWAEKILINSATLTRIPEPVRVAGLIARGLSRSV
jgi:uncharacterized protein